MSYTDKQFDHFREAAKMVSRELIRREDKPA